MNTLYRSPRWLAAWGMLGLLTACAESAPQVDFPTPVAKPSAPSTSESNVIQSSRNRAEVLATTYRIKLDAATPDPARTSQRVGELREQAVYLNDSHESYSTIATELSFRYNGSVQKLIVPLKRGKERFVPLEQAMKHLAAADAEADGFRFITLSNDVDPLKVHGAIAGMDKALATHGASAHAPRFFALSRQVDQIYAQLSPKPYKGNASTITCYALNAAEVLHRYRNDKAAAAAAKEADAGLADLLTQYGKTSEERVMLDQVSERILALQHSLEKRDPSLLGAITDDLKDWLLKHASDD